MTTGQPWGRQRQHLPRQLNPTPTLHCPTQYATTTLFARCNDPQHNPTPPSPIPRKAFLKINYRHTTSPSLKLQATGQPLGRQR